MKHPNAYKRQPLREDTEIKWLIGAIIFVAFVAIIIILITHPQNQSDANDDSYTTESSLPSTTSAPQESENKNSTTTKEEPEPDTTTQSKEPQNTQEQPSDNTAPSNSRSSGHCYHEEAGRCWDDIENEAYSAGLYDKQFGYYGASFGYEDDCDAICRDIVEDAYDEGWYDSY